MATNWISISHLADVDGFLELRGAGRGRVEQAGAPGRLPRAERRQARRDHEVIIDGLCGIN